MSNQDILDAGQPPPPVTIETDEDGNPTVTVAEPGSDEMNATLRHANALVATTGSESSPTGWGTYLRRVPAWSEGVVVAANTATVGPGAVIAVQVTDGGTSGPFAMIGVGSPASGQVLVEPQANGTQRLTFNAGDAVNECAVYLLSSSASLIAVLDADPVPPE